MWCILPMVYLLYNHCIFFLHLQLELIIKIKLSIVTITPLWSGLIKVRSGLELTEGAAKNLAFGQNQPTPPLLNMSDWIFCCICVFVNTKYNKETYFGDFWGVKVKVELITIWKDWTNQPEILLI